MIFGQTDFSMRRADLGHSTGDVKPGAMRYSGIQTRRFESTNPRPSTSTGIRLSTNMNVSSGRQLSRSTGRIGSRTGTQKNRDPSGQDENAKLEREYIENLQQQVHLLELELKLMQEREAQGALSREDVDVASRSAPLDSHLAHLRGKYVQLQEDHQKEVEDLQEQIDKREQRIIRMDEHIKHLNAQKATLANQFDEEKENARKKEEEGVHREVLLQKDIERLSKTLEYSNQDKNNLEHRLEEAKMTIHNSAVKYKELQDEFSDFKNKTASQENMLADAEKDAVSLKTRVIELEEESRLSGEHGEMYKKEISRLTAENSHLESDLKRTTREAEMLLANQKQVEEEFRALQNINSSMHEKYNEVLADLRLERERRAEATRVVDTAAEERAQLQQSLKRTNAEMERLHESLAGQQEELKQQQAEVQRHVRMLLKAESAREQAETELARTQHHLEETHAENQALREMVGRLESEDVRTKQLLDIATSSLKEKENEIVGLRSEVVRLRKKVAVSKSISELKMENFANMASANHQLAHNIKQLMEKMELEDGE